MVLSTGKGEDSVLAEINITPFTDILLVLLIVFMILAALIVPPGFQKQLPRSVASRPIRDDRSKTIEVDVNERGVVFVDGRRTAEKDIYNEMARVKARRGKLHVSIVADAKAPYGLIVRILDAARSVNLDDVGFVTG